MRSIIIYAEECHQSFVELHFGQLWDSLTLCERKYTSVDQIQGSDLQLPIFEAIINQWSSLAISLSLSFLCQWKWSHHKLLPFMITICSCDETHLGRSTKKVLQIHRTVNGYCHGSFFLDIATTKISFGFWAVPSEFLAQVRRTALAMTMFFSVGAMQKTIAVDLSPHAGLFCLRCAQIADLVDESGNARPFLEVGGNGGVHVERI